MMAMNQIARLLIEGRSAEDISLRMLRIRAVRLRTTKLTEVC
jgi:hypothetical protein